MNHSPLIGKTVVVIKADGFKKTGKVLSIFEGVLELELLNGRVEFIPLASISTINEISGVGIDGKK